MVTKQSVKTTILSLIAKANEVTGDSSADLTTAINIIADKYGKSSSLSDEEKIKVADEVLNEVLGGDY